MFYQASDEIVAQIRSNIVRVVFVLSLMNGKSRAMKPRDQRSRRSTLLDMLR